MHLNKKMKKKIWDREFILSIEYDCYKDEETTEKQKEIVEEFIAHDDWIENSKKKVIDYCKEALKEDGKLVKKDSIFSYVKPEYVFVKRDDKIPRIALMCKYRYDVEHGLAIVFSFDGKVTVGSQDIIL